MSSSSTFNPAFSYRRYDCTLENLDDCLNTNGVAVLPNVLSKEEVAKFRTSMWQEVSHTLKGRFQLEQEDTWKSFYDLMPLHSMLVQHWGLGHLQTIWDIRQHSAVANAFSNLWKTPAQDMLVSFDGLSIHMPSEMTGRGWYKNNNWLHTDQSSRKKGKQCIQGFITLYDVKPGDASSSVLQGSHKHHSSFFKHIGLDSASDWYKLEGTKVEEDSDSEAEEGKGKGKGKAASSSASSSSSSSSKGHQQDYFLSRGCERVCVEADAGSLVLWDSRTIHQGIEPQKGRPEENFRMIVYVCMMPRSKASAVALGKKQKAFKELRMTSHWADNPKLFPKTPRTWGKPLPDLEPVQPPQLTSLGKRLAGF